MITVQINQENKDQFDTKMNRLVTNADVTYLEDWITDIKL
jgi:hypothetical protein